MNDKRTSGSIRANAVPAQYEIVDKWGSKRGPFPTAEKAAAYAKVNWPDQEQDEDRTGKGWDVQVVGS